MKKYTNVVCGGTFDHFHKGHEHFLSTQLILSEKLYIGITSDVYIQKYKQQGIEPFSIRQKAVEDFLTLHHTRDRVKIAAIDDIYIPKIWETIDFEAIIVTPDTVKGAKQINEKRVKDHLPLLPIEIVDYVKAEDGIPISSSRIRNGEIDKQGNSFIKPIWLSSRITLPEYLRSTIKKPFGKSYKLIDEWLLSHPNPELVISIGDVVTQKLQEKNFHQQIAVVDLFVKREKVFSSLAQHHLDSYHPIIVQNPAGSLTPALFQAVQDALQGKKRIVIYIEGEEDLAVLPFVLAAPLGRSIIYGQPDEGVVVVEVTEEKKNQAKNIVEKFII